MLMTVCYIVLLDKREGARNGSYLGLDEYSRNWFDLWWVVSFVFSCRNYQQHYHGPVEEIAPMISERAVMTVAWFAWGRHIPRVGDPKLKYLQHWQNRIARERLDKIQNMIIDNHYLQS